MENFRSSTGGGEIGVPIPFHSGYKIQVFMGAGPDSGVIFVTTEKTKAAFYVDGQIDYSRWDLCSCMYFW